MRNKIGLHVNVLSPKEQKLSMAETEIELGQLEAVARDPRKDRGDL